VWGAFVWDRPLLGAFLIVVAAGAYARAGKVHPTLFGALVVSAVLLVSVTVHQLTHAAGVNRFDGADLLAVTIVLVCLAATGEVESWHQDWMVYGATIRSITAVSAIALAALADQPGLIRSWAEATPPSALARVVVAGAVAMIVLWVIVTNRPVRPGGRLRIATWTLATMLLLGALTHAFSLGAIRWVAVVALAAWGLQAMRGGLRRSHAWSVLGGFAVILGATLPVALAQPGLAPLLLLLLAVATATGAVVVFSQPENRTVPAERTDAPHEVW